MVAPYDIGDPARSFIRIPGTGSDPSLRSACLDLSQGAEAAAASPIPQNIPRLSLTTGNATKIGQSRVKSHGKDQETSVDQIPSSQPPSVERQHHVQVVLTGNRTSLSNNSQRIQTSQNAARKLPLKKEEKDLNNNILKRKMPESQIMLPCKVIKVNTGKIVTQCTPPQRTNFNIKTIKMRTVNNPNTHSITKPVKRISLPNSNGAAPNSQHPRGIPEYEKKRKLLNHPNQIKDQLFQEIFKDKRRLAALLKQLKVIQ